MVSTLLTVILGSEVAASQLFLGITIAIEFLCSVVFFVMITRKFERSKFSQLSLVVCLFLVIDIIAGLLISVCLQLPFQFMLSLISAGYLSLALIAGCHISSKLSK